MAATWPRAHTHCQGLAPPHTSGHVERDCRRGRPTLGHDIVDAVVQSSVARICLVERRDEAQTGRVSRFWPSLRI